MQKRILIYIMLFTFGMLILPKTFLHDCVRQHAPQSYSFFSSHDHDHSNDHHHHKHSSDNAQFSSSDDCPICDFHFFPFGIHHYQIQVFQDNAVYVSHIWEEAVSQFSQPKHLLRGPPSMRV